MNVIIVKREKRAISVECAKVSITLTCQIMYLFLMNIWQNVDEAGAMFLN